METIQEKITKGIRTQCLAEKLTLIEELRQDMKNIFPKAQNGNCFKQKTTARDGIRRIINSVN
jgi:hypothetical protein